MIYSVWYKNLKTNEWTEYTKTNNYWDMLNYLIVLRTALGSDYLVRYF